MQNLTDLNKWSSGLRAGPRMPALFLGHGSPMNAIEDNEFVQGFKKLSSTIPTPTAIICVSAHWFTQGTKVTAMEKPRTIHDFSGFPKELYNVNYPVKGDPALAAYTKDLVQPINIALDDQWGLDHGAWSVIKHLYPAADIPIIQLSIDYTKAPMYHFELAQQLQKLREQGVLIIGSGNIVHNLGMIDWANFDKDDYGYDWAIEARATINEFILSGNYSPLINYHEQSQAFKLAIPSPDHYLPLLYTLGLQSNGEQISIFNDKLMAGSLSMTSIKIE
ncbi:MAG: 4,5-DOPA dioxygenase extradiol [Sediminibacterium sp.]